MYVRLKDGGASRGTVDAYLIELIRGSGAAGLDLGFTGQKVHKKFPNFNVKDYGYATFSKLLQSIPNLRIERNNIHYEE